jgi:4'-phosphopantetheinyl transferase
MTELWLVDLERAAPALQALESAEPRLSEDDRARARKIVDLRERRHRLAAYIALRVALERIAGRQVRGADFARVSGGKPSLAVGRAAFSLSHSDGFALLGVTRLGEIGVDLERARSVRLSRLRQRLIVAAGNGLAGMPLTAEDNEEAFLQAWSRLEAFAKARGSGLARLLADVGARGGGSTTARVEAAARRVVGEAGLKVRDLTLPPGLYGAVTVGEAASVPRVRAFPANGPAIERLLTSRAAPGRGR